MIQGRNKTTFKKDCLRSKNLKRKKFKGHLKVNHRKVPFTKTKQTTVQQPIQVINMLKHHHYPMIQKKKLQF